jgi:hypothetical protein
MHMTRRPLDEDVDKWVERERCEEWLAGPSEDKKCAWMRRHRDTEFGYGWDYDDDVVDLLRRDAILTHNGIVDSLVNFPFRIQAMLGRTALDVGWDYRDETDVPPLRALRLSELIHPLDCTAFPVPTVPRARRRASGTSSSHQLT